jgi:DNA-binding transcriptional MerR regulator
MKSFSGTQAAEIVGITYRRLDYWARTDLVRPSGADATGSGSRREYTYRDLLELKVIKKLLDAGIRLESIRDVFAYMREHVDTDISAAHLVINGSSVILCDGDELIEIATKIRFTRAAETATGDEPHIEWARRSRRHRQRIDTRVGEFIEENNPVL